MPKKARMIVRRAGRALIKEFEQCRLEAYQDHGGIWTIGWGHTGPEVKEGDTISQEVADQIFLQDVDAHSAPIANLIAQHGISTSPSQFDAMCSLAYNIGVNGFIEKSSVWKFHQQGNYCNAAASFLMWRKVNGEDSRGLLRRRCREAALYCRDRW